MSIAYARKPATAVIRPIAREDNPGMAHVIRAVMTEFGCTAQGFAIHDPEVDAMYETYSRKKSAYFVIADNGNVAGGGGVAPLKGGDKDTCELQKFYILPEWRGLGYGQQLLEKNLAAARAFGFRRAYIETTAQMNHAAALYRHAGFTPIKGPLGDTGHFSCDRWYAMEL